MKKAVNFGVDVMATGKAWSERAVKYQNALGKGIELRSRAEEEKKSLRAGIASLENLKGSVFEGDIPEMRKKYETRIAEIDSALKQSLADEAAWAWEDAENKWAKIMIETEDIVAREQATVMLYKTVYGMEVSRDWARAVIASLGLDTLGNLSKRKAVRTGDVVGKIATANTVKKAYMGWNVLQCQANGLRKYMFAEDIVDMYRTRKERETRANALPSAFPVLDEQEKNATK